MSSNATPTDSATTDSYAKLQSTLRHAAAVTQKQLLLIFPLTPAAFPPTTALDGAGLIVLRTFGLPSGHHIVIIVVTA